jgi:hypothetical protein
LDTLRTALLERRSKGGASHTVRKCDFEFELSVLPNRLVFSRNGAFPFLEVENAGGGADRPCDEAEGVVFAPLLSEMGVRKWYLAGVM